MKSNPQHVITEPIIPEREVASKAKLHWVGIQKYGPTYVAKPISGSDPTRQTFCDTIQRAERRLWILDKKFDDVALSTIWQELYSSRILDIRILAEKDQIDSIRSWLEDQKRRQGETLIIDGYRVIWKTPKQSERYQPTFTSNPGQLHQLLLQTLALLPKVHDRFALIDDELWHFGGTVGVLEGQGLCAVSRGWYSEAEEFVHLFTQCLWRKK